MSPFYDVEIVATTKTATINKRLYSINVGKTIDEIKKTDMIFIPIICSDFTKTAEVNEKYRDWVIDQYRGGAEIVSLCVGSFFLASTGLLNQRKCAIHWTSKNQFELMYPDVNVVDETIMTDENGIYTCGGGYTFLNLLLYVIEKHLGREMSVLASKIFENNATEMFTVDGHREKVGVSRRTFERRFKKGTGNSVSEYIQRVKVEATKKQLEVGSKTINEISFDIGYNDVDAFRKVFKRYTDLSPLEWRRRYGVG